MAWQKGQSGNPGGRPRVQVARAQAFSNMIDEATDGGREILVGLLEEVRRKVHTPSDAARRVRCFELLLDRWAGKALETVDVVTEAGRPPLRGLGVEALAKIDAVIDQVLADTEPPTEH